MAAELNAFDDALSDRSGPLSPTDCRTGELIADKYRLEAVLGEGGMGVVFRASHVELNRRVAIKVVRSDLAKSEEVVARMLEEARAAANIRSEHVTRVLDLGRLATGAPFIVFEYLEGKTLAELLEEYGSLPAESSVDFILQICDALAEAHKSGIVHRDLKPENLFLTRRSDGTAAVKVLDFGISKNLTARDRRAALTNPTKIVGSPYYMSPEQMRAGKAVDARADIWALGVVLYELCTGRTPFSGGNIPEICAMVLNTDPMPPRCVQSDLAEGLESAIMRCLGKDPDERFADVGELACALASFGSPEAILYAERISKVVAATPQANLRLLPPNSDVRIQSAAAPIGWSTLRSVSSPFVTPRGVLSASNSDSHVVSISGHPPALPKARWPWLLAAGGCLFGLAAGAILTAFVPLSALDTEPSPAAPATPAAVQTAPPVSTPPPPPPKAPSDDESTLMDLESTRSEIATSVPANTQSSLSNAEQSSTQSVVPAEKKPEVTVRTAAAPRVKAVAKPTPQAAPQKASVAAATPVSTSIVEASAVPPSVPAPATAATQSNTNPPGKAPAPPNPWDPRSFGGRR